MIRGTGEIGSKNKEMEWKATYTGMGIFHDPKKSSVHIIKAAEILVRPGEALTKLHMWLRNYWQLVEGVLVFFVHGL